MERRSDFQSLARKFSDRMLEQTQGAGLYWTGSFYDYLDQVSKNPLVLRNAFQRLYDMILSWGIEEEARGSGKKKIVRYKFFRDPIGGGVDAVFGIESSLNVLVNVMKSAADGYATDRRILLLHGPVGSAKSTIVRLLKKGLEHYSCQSGGALYTFGWRAKAIHSNEKKMAEHFGEDDFIVCPMHEDPFRLIPEEHRQAFLVELLEKSLGEKGKELAARFNIKGDLCPYCRYCFKERMREHGGDWRKLIDNDIRVQRLVISEKDRIGIGTFQPKDEKNQDSTELTGDINYRKIAQYGSDSDPRAFNFDGEFNIANRGLIEFIEILKLDVAFLYDLLGASQEHKIKPKKFPQTDIDEVIIGHTNGPEFKKLKGNELMEAFRDRTILVDIPYNIRLADELRVYQRDFGPDKRFTGKHIAPHTLEMAAMWAVLTRLDNPKKASLSRLQKLKLYNGKTLPGFTEDSVKELQDESADEGLFGISPRYIQDKLSNALVADVQGADASTACVNPFMVLKELKEGLGQHSLLNAEQVKEFSELLEIIGAEYGEILKNEVQRAVAADEEALSKLAANYLDNIRAYTMRQKMENKFTGQKEEPNERLMRSVEEKLEIPENRKDDFRREIMNYIGALSLEGKPFNFRNNERLAHAFELKLFEDQKDTLKLTSMMSTAVDPTQQAKIDVVKSRLVKNYGYCDVCATDVLNYVASIFARGDAKK